MRKQFIIVLLLLFAFSALAFADAPPPPPSNVIVHLVKNGIAENSIQQITYNCPENQSPDQGLNYLNCTAGTCTNTPHYGSICAYFQSGYFSYTYLGQNQSSQSFNNSQIGFDYEYSLDVGNGKITELNSTSSKRNYNYIPVDGPVNNQICAPYFFINILFIALFFRKKV